MKKNLGFLLFLTFQCSEKSYLLTNFQIMNEFIYSIIVQGKHLTGKQFTWVIEITSRVCQLFICME